MNNRKKIIGIFLTVFVILCCVLIIFKFDDLRKFAGGESDARSTRKGHQGVEAAETSKRRIRTEGSAYADPRVRKYLAEDKYTIKVGRLSEYLAKHERSPESLVAAFLLSQDPALLAELRNHMDNSDAVMCLLQATTSPEEKQKLVDLYIKMNPEEMTGYLMNAWLVSKNEGMKGDQLALIMKGMSATEFSGGFGHTNAALIEALLSAGMSTTDSQIYLTTNSNQTGRLFYTCLDMLTSGSKLAISAAATPQNKKTEAEKFLSVADSFKELSPYSFENGKQLYYTSVLKMLKQLPDDMVLEGYGNSVSEYRETMQNEAKELARTRSVTTDLLSKASPTQVDQYFEKRQNEGFEAANHWLIESKAK